MIGQTPTMSGQRQRLGLPTQLEAHGEDAHTTTRRRLSGLDLTESLGRNGGV